MVAGEYLVPWVRAALRALGGRGTIIEVCRNIWQSHEEDLRTMGDRFYTWQYDVRWAAYELRRRNEARLLKEGNVSIWELV